MSLGWEVVHMFMDIVTPPYCHCCRYCGHREASVVVDRRPHGFPFDRIITFDINENPATKRFCFVVITNSCYFNMCQDLQ